MLYKERLTWATVCCMIVCIMSELSQHIVFNKVKVDLEHKFRSDVFLKVRHRVYCHVVFHKFKIWNQVDNQVKSPFLSVFNTIY